MLPDDGKEKKPSYSSPFDTPLCEAAALSNQVRRFSFAQSRIGVLGREPHEGDYLHKELSMAEKSVMSKNNTV